MEKWQRATHTLIQMQKDVVASVGDLDAAMRAVVHGAGFVIEEAEGVAIEIIDENEQVYRVAQGLCHALQGLRRPLESGLSGLALARGEPMFSADIWTDDRVDQEAGQAAGIRSVILAPLPREMKPPALLALVSSKPNAFEERDVALAQLLIMPLHYALARTQSRATARMFEATFDQAAVGMAHVAPDGSFIRVNDRFCEIAGYSAEELLTDGFQHITHPDDLEVDLAYVSDLLADRIGKYAMEKRYIRKDGSVVWVNLTVSLVHHADGSPDFMVSVIEDISARKAAESLASYDPLTGLPNRRMILERLDAMLDAQAQGGEMVGLAFLDLDNFKSVNDRHGHLEGDRCLMAIGEELNRGIRKQDLLGRYGGDEFVLLMSDVSEKEAEAILSRLAASIRRLAQAHDWDVGVSIGATLAGSAEVGGEGLLRAADGLMYSAKHGDVHVLVRTIGERRAQLAG